MTTMRQAAANRQNAQKSTGPKTEEGKAQSRQNGVTHGLATTAFVTPEFAAKFEQRKEAWRSRFTPTDNWQEFELCQVVLSSIRLEQCQKADLKRRSELAKIAADPGTKWEIARHLEAVRLGGTLKRNPERVAMELRLTAYGRGWLLMRWARLLAAVPETGETHWTESETHQALDLLGMPTHLRAGVTTDRPEFANTGSIRTLILQQVAILSGEQANRNEEVAQLRQDHAQGFQLENDAALKQNRRYEADAYRRMIRATKSFAKSKISTLSPAIVVVEKTPDVAVEPAVVEVSTPSSEQPEAPKEPFLKGNRQQRRKQAAQSRKDAHHARTQR